MRRKNILKSKTARIEVRKTQIKKKLERGN